jgi:hypothetical protein
MYRLVIGIVCLSCLGTLAAGQTVFPIQQQRYITANVTTDPNHAQTVAATGFDTWQADLALESPEDDVWADAGQYSFFSPTAIDAFGAADIGFSGQNWGDHRVGALSSCRLRFAVSERTTFDLVGALSVEIDGAHGSDYHEWETTVSTRVELRRIAGQSIYADGAEIRAENGAPLNQAVDVPVTVAGELTPGVYELLVAAELAGSDEAYASFAGEASYILTATFAPVPPANPTAGDLDGDGDVDLVDFARFQDGFGGPLLQAWR